MNKKIFYVLAMPVSYSRRLQVYTGTVPMELL